MQRVWTAGVAALAGIILLGPTAPAKAVAIPADQRPARSPGLAKKAAAAREDRKRAVEPG